MDACLAVSDLTFRWPGARTPLLDIENFHLARNERVLLRGASGSGKSTLLGLLAGIQRPDAGKIELLNHNFSQLSSARRDRLRADHMGYIFQQFNLLPYLNAIDNVLLATRFSKVRRQRIAAQGKDTEQAQQLLQQLGLIASDTARPAAELSVGQQQRVAAARALLGGPELLIADEPTSALDTAHRDRFLQLLFEACEAQQTSLLFVTHDATLATHFDRQLELTDINRVQEGGVDV